MKMVIEGDEMVLDTDTGVRYTVPVSEDREKDAGLLALMFWNDHNMRLGVCPSGCAPLKIEDTGEKYCSECDFRQFWSRSQRDDYRQQHPFRSPAF